MYDECGHAIFFDDGGAYASRIMRKAESRGFDPCETDIIAGLFYNEEAFLSEALAGYMLAIDEGSPSV